MNKINMKKEILIVKNITREGPGILEKILQEQKINYTVKDLQREDKFPSIENLAAVIVLGGPDSANDKSNKIRNEIEFIRNILRRGISYLGICLGLQVLVKAAGGKVVKSPVKEIGFIDPEGNNFTAELTEAGKHDPLFENLGSSFNVFHLHGETVELTDGMVLLASGKFCRNQIVKVGSNAYGIQSHFELTPEMLETWINEDSDLRQLDQNQLRTNFEGIKDEYTHVGKQLFRNFLKTAGL